MAEKKPICIYEGELKEIQESDTIPDSCIPAHGPSHEDEGADEISVQGLSGLSADPQTPLISFFQKARAYRSVDQVIFNGEFTKIGVNASSFDPSNIIDFNYNRIKPTKAGYYVVLGNISIVINYNAARVIVYLSKNGGYTSNGFDFYSAGVSAGGSVTDLIYFDGVNDYVELLAYQNSGADRGLAVQEASNYLAVLGPF